MTSSLLTLFSCPKPFTNAHIAAIQRNAIGSWAQLGEQVNVILMGNESGVAQAAAEFGVRHIPEVACSPLGVPLIDSMFALARQGSDSTLLAYVNADILLLPDLLAAAQQVAARYARFLLVGQRWDLEVQGELDLSAGWQDRLRQQVQQTGRLHGILGIDCFVFPSACYIDMPPFVIGRAGWDNWMLYHAHRQKWPLIDMTASVMVVHQEHDYSHLPNQTYYGHPETEENIRLAGGKINTHFSLLDANRRLVAGCIRPVKFSWFRLMRLAELLLIRLNRPSRRFFTVLHDSIYLRRVKLQSKD